MSAAAEGKVVAAKSSELGINQTYARLAPEYDRQLNPLLSLEDRILTPLLPDINGKTVLDVGCGTGRWLTKILPLRPSRLVGVDLSAEMLSQARAKLGNNATLELANATALPVQSESVEVVLCSFVASYVADIHQLARELARVCAINAHVFVVDMHPQTRQKLGWERSFRTNKGKIRVSTETHSCEQLIECFSRAGFHLTYCLEPGFGPDEREVFEIAGKLPEFEQAVDHPAILMLGFQKPKRSGVEVVEDRYESLGLTGARVALDSDNWINCQIDINHDRIVSINSRSNSTDSSSSIDLCGFAVLPGLINAHDHLEFALFPRLGKGRYSNASQWAQDIYHPAEEPIASLCSIDKSVRLWWGGIRNLLSGVTTVCHHNEYSPVFDHNFPVRILREYRWAHSLCFERDVRSKVGAKNEKEPFFIHLAEGTDADAQDELKELDRLGLLTARTVLIHALGVNESGWELMRKRGASVVWCPSSNLFLFGQTLTAEQLTSAPKLALGSDSPLTCAGDLLDEMSLASSIDGVSPNTLYGFVTQNAARMANLQNGEGAIRPGSIADLVALGSGAGSPAEALTNSSFRNIELVMLGGRVKLVSNKLKERVSRKWTCKLEPIRIDGVLRWIDAPVKKLLRATEAALGDDIRLGGKWVTCG